MSKQSQNFGGKNRLVTNNVHLAVTNNSHKFSHITSKKVIESKLDSVPV